MINSLFTYGHESGPLFVVDESLPGNIAAPLSSHWFVYTKLVRRNKLVSVLTTPGLLIYGVLVHPSKRPPGLVSFPDPFWLFFSRPRHAVMMPIQTTVPSLPRACAARQDGCGGTFCAEGGRDRLHCLHEAKSPGEIVPWGKMSRGEHSALRKCLAGRPGRTPLEHMYM